MIREKLNVIFSSKVFYLVFSVLVSIALWAFVQISVNKIEIFEVKEVQITRLNEDVLNDRNMMISSVNPENVEFTFECPRSIGTKLSNTTVSVEIDLIGITTRGYKWIQYEIVYPDGVDTSLINVVSKSVEQISLYVDQPETRTIQVEAPYSGGVAEGFILDSTECDPQTVTVSGPADVVSRISKARVNILRENLTSTYTEALPFVLLDENGAELEQPLFDRLSSISDQAINVVVNVRATKAVSLNVDLVYGSGATLQNTNYTITPATVLLAGNPEDIKDYNSINLGTIDLSKLVLTDTIAFPIVIPNSFTNLSGEAEAHVVVETMGLEIRHFSVSNIQVIKEPAGYTAEIRTQSIDVRIRGRAEDMVNLTESNIRVVADLTDAGPGTQRVVAKVYVDGIEGDVGAVVGGSTSNYYITVSLALARDIHQIESDP